MHPHPAVLTFSTLSSVEHPSIAEENEPQRTQRGKAATEAAKATAENAKYAKAVSRRISSQVANNFDDCSAENAKQNTYFYSLCVLCVPCGLIAILTLKWSTSRRAFNHSVHRASHPCAVETRSGNSQRGGTVRGIRGG